MRNFSFAPETFTAANGTSTRLQDFFDGVRSYVSHAEFEFGLSYDDAQDLFQDAAYELLERAHRFDGRRSSAKTFGYMIARHCHSNSFRKEKNREIPFGKLTSRDDKAALNSYLDYKLSEDGRTPETELIEREEPLKESPVFREVRALKEDDREMMFMLAQGHKPREMAEELNLKPSVLHTRLCRVKQLLRSRLRA